MPKMQQNKNSLEIDEWALEKLRSEGEAALDNEAKVFEQDLGKASRLGQAASTHYP